jgi:16S rRNA (guanine527-N7)-methyltransferase
MNIISGRSEADIIPKHFLDSLLLLPYMNIPDGFVIDLGSGGGFPGIPLKIMMPALHLYLTDSSRKKTSFLSHVASTLDLTDTHVIRGRIEDLAQSPDLTGKFDTVVSRAAFKLDMLLPFAASFLKPGGRLIAMKGSELPLEIRAAETAAGDAGMTLAPESPQDSSVNYSVRKIIIYNRL